MIKPTLKLNMSMHGGLPLNFLFQDDISSPIAAHLLDFCDDGGGADLFAAVNASSEMFTASSEDTSSSSITTPPGPGSHGDNTSAMAAPTAFSPIPSFDSTLSALLEEDDPPVNDGELLLPIEYQYAAAAVGVDPPTEQQEQFNQMAVTTAEHAALQTQMSSTASELMQFASSAYTDDCFAAAMGAGAGGYVGLDEAALCQPPLLSAGVGEAAVQGGCFFGKEAAAQGGGFFGAGGCGGMVMSMMGMDEIGEYQRMVGGGAVVPTHSPDAEAPMPFGGNAGEMQVEFRGRSTQT